MEIIILDQNCPKEWIKQIAEIHRKELSAGIFSVLGLEFLELFYTHLLNYQDSILIAIIKQNEVLGFISGIKDTKKFFRNLVLVHWLLLISIVLKKMLRPTVIFRVLRFLFSKNSHDLPKTPTTELFSFAITEKIQRQGLGEKLFKKLQAHFESISNGKFKVIASTTQQNAINFYIKMGGKKVGTCRLGTLDCYIFVYS